MSARLTPKPSILSRKASFMKDKLMETANKTIGSRLSSPAVNKNKLTAREQQILNEALKHIIVHLRARLYREKFLNGMEKESMKLFMALDQDANVNSPNPTTSTMSLTVQDAKSIAMVGETNGLASMLETLHLFTIQSISNVVKLVLLNSDAPLLPLSVLGEVVFLQQKTVKEKGSGAPLDVDALRGALGKAPARNIDLLGQLITLLSEDKEASSSKLAYTFGPLLFLPRFDNDSKISREYAGFDVLGSTGAVVAATKTMIDMVSDVFALDDLEIIKQQAEKMHNKISMQNLPIDLKGIQHLGLSGKSDSSTSLGNKRDKNNKYKVAYSFEAENEGEISIREGETVMVLVKAEDGWWTGINSNGNFFFAIFEFFFFYVVLKKIVCCIAIY